MASSADASLIVFCWGNTSRGDDGIGPLLAQRLRALSVDGLVVIEDHQLNIEHVMDFDGSTPLLFIDASLAVERGFRIERIGPSEENNFSTHAISPQALLNVYRKTKELCPPPAFLLHVAARDFGLGTGLSTVAETAVDDVADALSRIFTQPRDQWLGKLEQGLP